MKQILLLIFVFSFSQICLAQVPGLINYQAVARNTSGQALANQPIKVRISLIASEPSSSTTFYSETREVTTNALGLFNVQIGATGALSTYGNINNTNWTDGTKSRMIKVELDMNNSGNFTDMGYQQLVTVPYAFAAQKAVTAEKVTAPYMGFTAVPKTAIPLNTNDNRVIFGHEDHDSTNTYDPSAGTFTVPEDGMYMLYTSLAVSAQVASNPTDQAAVIFSSETRGPLHYNGAHIYHNLQAGHNALSTTAIHKLVKGEKIVLRVYRYHSTVNWLIGLEGSFWGAYKIK